jgi:hypothetical protein
MDPSGYCKQGVATETYTQLLSPVGVTREEIENNANNQSSRIMFKIMEELGTETISNSTLSELYRDINFNEKMEDIIGIAGVVGALYGSSSASELVVNLNPKINSPYGEASKILNYSYEYNIKKSLYLIQESEEYNFIIRTSKQRNQLINILDEYADEINLDGGYDNSQNEQIFDGNVDLFIQKVKYLNENYDETRIKYQERKNMLENEFDKMMNSDELFIEALFGAPLES